MTTDAQNGLIAEALDAVEGGGRLMGWEIADRDRVAGRHQRELDAWRGRLNRVGRDRDATGRQSIQQCRYCWYVGRHVLVCWALTWWTCGRCGCQDMHRDTAVPVLCEDCAKQLNACQQCGGTMD